MKIIVIHGSNILASKQYLDSITSRFKAEQVVRSYGKEITKEFLLNNFSGLGLFESERLVVLDNPESDFEIDKLPEAEGVFLVVFYSKELGVSSSILKSRREVKVVNYSEVADKRIFSFLDLVADRNKRALNQAKELIDEMGEQYILTMLYFMLRRLVVGGKKLPSGISRKLENQRVDFSKERIGYFYKRLLEADYKMKSGFDESRMGLFLVVEEMVH